MQLEIAQGIVEGAEVEDVELQLREDYSGRCMYYGKTTAAVVADNLGDFLAGLARYCGDLDPCHQDGDIAEAVLDVQNLRQDSMGRGIVLY